jgi:UDP-3-O-[3-hydroxymyristoyl] glucosamine N-acyltransferase
MRKVKLSVNQLIIFIGSELDDVLGNYDGISIDNISAVDDVDEFTLDWVNPAKKNKQEIAEASKARVLLVSSEICYSESMKAAKKVLLVTKNPKVILANIGNNFFVPKNKPEIHPTVIIHPCAKIGKNVSIGAYSVLGSCKIGDDTVIDTNVTIYDETEIGHHCVIKSNVVLGGEGFGYEKDNNGNLFRFPQIGKLVIGNYVDIGSCTCIDRGALTDTTIEDYTKINNLCHIAHNNKIGSNVVITAQVNISGSNTIENNVWIAPNSSICGWLKIGHDAIIGMGAVVTKNVPSDETWVGNPARKL